MSHKVAVQKIDWDSLNDELESIERPKSSSKVKKAYVAGAVGTALMLLGVSLGVMISATTPTGFPTVIEPGSQVSNNYYLVFADSGIIYARNGTTGAIDSSGSNPSIIINQAINNTPEMRTVYIVGDFNFTSKIVLLKPMNLVFDGVLTVYHSAFIEIGDASHFVEGGTLRLNIVDGVDQNANGLVFKDATAFSVYFAKIERFNVGIYFDPVGTGSGENSFYGGWITACNFGVDWNPTGLGKWAQGNRFYASIYASDVSGVRITGTTFCDMQLFQGTIDSLVGIDPTNPSNGGGRDINDTKGYSIFILLWAGASGGGNILGPGTILTTFNGLGPRLGIPIVKTNVSATIGLNNAYGASVSVWDLSGVPRNVNIVWFGSFAGGGENVTVGLQSVISDSTTAIIYKMATGPGSVNLTLDELYHLTKDGYSLERLRVYAKTDQASTNVQVSVNVWS